MIMINIIIIIIDENYETKLAAELQKYKFSILLHIL